MRRGGCHGIASVAAFLCSSDTSFVTGFDITVGGDALVTAEMTEMSRGLFDLTGRVVLATGANSGIGLGFLQGCAKQGADVVVWRRRREKNAAALVRINESGESRC